MRRRLALGAVLLVIVAACAPATATSGRGEARSPELLSRAEWADANINTAFEAIERLRPQFLKVRGETSIRFRDLTQVNVYLDDTRLGGVETLRTMPLGGIQSIRYLSAGEATYRWGINQTGGAIQLRTR